MPAVEELIDSLKKSAESSKIVKRISANKIESAPKAKLLSDSNIVTDKDELKNLPFVKQVVEEELPFVKQTEDNSFDSPIAPQYFEDSIHHDHCSTKIPVKQTKSFTPVPSEKFPRLDFNLLNKMVQTPKQDKVRVSSPIRFHNEDFGLSESNKSQDNSNQVQMYNSYGNDSYSPSKPTTDNSVIVIESDDDSDCCIINPGQVASNLPLPRPSIDFGDSPSSSPLSNSQNVQQKKNTFDQNSSYLRSTPLRLQEVSKKTNNYSKISNEDSEKLPFVNNNASATNHSETLSLVKSVVMSPNERSDKMSHTISRDLSYDNRTSSSDESRMSNDPMFADNCAPLPVSPPVLDRSHTDWRADRFRQQPYSMSGPRHTMSPRSSRYDKSSMPNYGHSHHRPSRKMSPTYNRSRSPVRWDIDKRSHMNVHPSQSEFGHSKINKDTSLSRNYKSPIVDSDYNDFNKRTMPRRHPTSNDYNRNIVLRPAPSRTANFIGLPPNRMNIRPEPRSYGQAPSRNDERPPLLPVPTRPYDNSRY